MDRLNPSMSQFSDEEEAENFPEDHFGSDDELYDSEFGSVIHDLRSTEYNDENDKPEVSVNHNLTTITEESIADDFGNISFKPATNFLQVFDEDQQRVAWENLLRVPDQPTEEMLKKQYSWEPSLLNSPPVIVNELNVSNNMERSRIRTNHNRSLRNQSAVAEREKSPANEIRGGKSTRIPIRRPKQSVLFSKMEVSRSKIDQIGERQEKTSRLKIVESIPSMNEDHIPKQVNLVQELNEGEDEEKENYQSNKTPNKNTDFSATIVSMTGHAVSTPKDSSEDASNDLSMLCRSISTIGEVSPKVRPNFVDSRRFMLRQLETSKANASRAILKTIPETLSSTAIDRALSDPECRTVISDATDIQQKFVRKIRQHGSPQKNLRAHQTGDKLTDLKNRLGKQLNASKRMRSNLTESRGSLLQHHEKSRASRAVLQTIPETLSSTAIDRALSDPEVHTVISDATEVQQKLAFKILRHGSSRFYPSRDPLADLKNRMEKQLNASKRKRQLTKLQQL